MTRVITLRPRPGQPLQELLAELRDIADNADNDQPVTTGHGGINVTDHLALAYLTAIHTPTNQPASPDTDPTTASRSDQPRRRTSNKGARP